MSHILEHLPDPMAYLTKVMNKMKQNAFLFIEVPNRDDLYKKSLGLHTLVFNAPALRNFMIKIGFHILNIITVGSPVLELIPNENIYFKKKIINKIPKTIKKNIFKHINKKILNKFMGTFKRKTLKKHITSNFYSLEINDYGKNRRLIRVLVKK